MVDANDNDAAYLWDMLDACRAVSRFVENRSFHAYLGDLLLRSGVERQIEIIGEAASRVSEATRVANPDIPWRRIIAQRNVLAHEYGELKHELLWQVASEHVPNLIGHLERITPNPPKDPDES
jgi:uncharacterized protein with HEPN domain